MAVILCLETATTNCSVALSVNGSVIALREDRSREYSHAEKLHVFVKEVLEAAAIDKSGIDAIAVSKGPGSYTGLRIGVSAAKGLCFALGIPLISILTLEVLAEQISENVCTIPMLDARRMEVYAAVYDAEKNVLRETKAEVLDENSFSEYLSQGKTVFIGNGAEKFQNICNHPNAHFITDAFPSAKEMVALATASFHHKSFEDVAYFEPFYLKDFLVSRK